VDKDKKSHGHSGSPSAAGSAPAHASTEKRPSEQRSSEPGDEHSPELDEFFRQLKPEMRHPKPSSDAVAAALEAAQRLADEAGVEHAAEGPAEDFPDRTHARKPVRRNLGGGDVVCVVCGYRNSLSNRFCGMCGVAIEGRRDDSEAASKPGRQIAEDDAPLSPSITLGPDPFGDPAAETEMRPPAPERQFEAYPGAHHYHHHYHHHYFPGGHESMSPGMSSSMNPSMSAGMASRAAADPARDVDRFRPTAALRGDMSRAEAAVRRIAHEWVLACNTKHLDDLLELYGADALLLRSNFPPIRGAAAVREFFFGGLDAGLGEVELEPLRVDVIGDLAYEAGRCKALVPSATGKRREERGKYLWVLTRQSGGEWKITADCWSSDLTLTTMESDVPPGAVKSSQPRKS
jgi:ketosteroid isomerase-like protein